MALCAQCKGTGIIEPTSTFSLPMKCYRCAGAGSVDLKDLRLGDHACCLFDNAREQLASMASFFAEGIQKNERCVSLFHQNSISVISQALAKKGVDVPAARANGSLVFLAKDEVYLMDGIFNPQAIIDRFRGYIQDTLNEGFKGMRVAAEMSWAMDAPNHSQELVGYELMVDLFFLDEQPKMAAICQYDRSRFPGAVIEGARIAHRLVFQD